MNKATIALTLGILGTVLIPAAFGQGISEMGGAYAGSSTLQSGARQGANSANSTFGALNMQMQAGIGSAPSVRGDKIGMPGLDWPSAKVTVMTAAKESNKIYNLAVQKEKAGKLAEAVSLYTQALAYRQNIWGYKDPAVLNILEKMGDLHNKLGHYKVAAECYRRGVAAAVKQFGQGEFKLCPYLVKVAQACYAQKDYQAAYNYMNQVYMLRLRKLGEDNKDTIAAATVVAKICIDAGSYGEASELLKKSLEGKERNNDTNSKAYLGLLDDYAAVLHKQRQDQKATDIEAKAKELREKLGEPAATPAAAQEPSGSKAAESSETKSGQTSGDSQGAKNSPDSKESGKPPEGKEGSSKESSDAGANQSSKADSASDTKLNKEMMTKSSAPNGVQSK